MPQTSKMQNHFEIKDCTLIIQVEKRNPIRNLNELKMGIEKCSEASLFHHFCELPIRPIFEDLEYRNDFAIWIGRGLRDQILAERFGIINPYSFEDIEHLRSHSLQLITQRLYELKTTTIDNSDEEFRLMKAVTMVFPTGNKLKTYKDFIQFLPKMSLSAVYYHFVEARRRTRDKMDDFTVWFRQFGNKAEPVIHAFSKIDFYFLTLEELKQKLIQVLKHVRKTR